MKKYYLILLVLINTTILANSFSIGGVANKQSGLYRGKENKNFLPYINLKYDNFFIKGSEIGYQFLKNNSTTLSFYTNLQDGYSIKARNMNYGFQSIKDRKKQVTIGLKGSQVLNMIGKKFNLSGSFESGKRGEHIALNLSQLFMLDDNFILIPSINSKYYFKNYSRYYFGIKEEELGGYIIKKYQPNTSHSFGIGLYSEYYLDKAISIFGYINVDRYSKEVRKSPIIKNNIVTNIGVGAKFTF